MRPMRLINEKRKAFSLMDINAGSVSTPLYLLLWELCEGMFRLPFIPQALKDGKWKEREKEKLPEGSLEKQFKSLAYHIPVSWHRKK